MNIRPDILSQSDVQNQIDHRLIEINEVGVRDLIYPILLGIDGNIFEQNCNAKWTMAVELSPTKKGTHMSRFIEILEQQRDKVFNLSIANQLFDKMLTRLHSKHGRLEVEFPFFATKKAPVSKIKSLMDYQGGYSITKIPAANNQSEINNWIWIKVPVTSLCPCSKMISEYGAHNQRSVITIRADISIDNENNWFSKIINLTEQQASSQLYGIIKRSDEKYITEQAYDNPKFVEDLVRDISLQLHKMPTVKHFEVMAENYESIHNHSAYAIVRG